VAGDLLRFSFHPISVELASKALKQLHRACSNVYVSPDVLLAFYCIAVDAVCIN
jgi:hypothetical protein